MAQSKFAQRLYKEFVRNPKKSALLGLISLVAIWFWVPLVWKWIAPEDFRSTAPIEVAENTGPVVAKTVISTEAVAALDHPDIPQVNWRKSSQIMQDHYLMASGELAESMSSPFVGWPEPEEAPELVETEDTKQLEDEPVAIITPRTPEAMGLGLTSTVIGQDIRLAVINGQACELNTTLVVPDGEEEVEFELVSIHQNSVQLRCAETVFELQRTPMSTEMTIAGIASGRKNIGTNAGERIIIKTLQDD